MLKIYVANHQNVCALFHSVNIFNILIFPVDYFQFRISLSFSLPFVYLHLIEPTPISLTLFYHSKSFSYLTHYFFCISLPHIYIFMHIYIYLPPLLFLFRPFHSRATAPEYLPLRDSVPVYSERRQRLAPFIHHHTHPEGHPGPPRLS